MKQAGGFLLAALLCAAVGCSPKSVDELTGTYVLQGSVTSSLDGSPVDGATVTLLAGDATNPLTTTTSAAGFYAFSGLPFDTDLVVQVSKEGFTTKTETFGNSHDAVDGGTTPSPRSTISGSMVLDPETTVPPPPPGPRGMDLGGWVYAGGNAASSALVRLYSYTSESYVADTTADASGHFLFPNMPLDNYALRVWPYDKDDNGVSDYRLYSRNLGPLDHCSDADAGPSTCEIDTDFTNLVVFLEQKIPDIVAGSFERLSTESIPGHDLETGYPLSATDLTNGVTGVMVDPTLPIYLHFGSEVDVATAQFTLTTLDDAGNGTPIPLTATWDSNVVVTLTPDTPLGSDASAATFYVLRIYSLRFLDGSVMFRPDLTDFGTITFSTEALPNALPNPTPQLYVADVADLAPPARAASQALVDESTLWLADVNGDLLFGNAPSSHWTDASGVQLTWDTVPGAKSYRIYAREVPPATDGAWDPNYNVDARNWHFLQAYSTSTTPDALPFIEASGVMQGVFSTFGLYLDSNPFAFGNSVQLAVTSVDFEGFESPIDDGKLLTLKDGFLPFVVSGSADYTGFSAPFNVTYERGSSFQKVVRVDFQEEMDPSQTPSVIPEGGSLRLRGQGEPGWGRTYFGAVLDLATHGSCTETLIPRTGSSSGGPADQAVPVRDASFFSAGVGPLVVLNSTTATYLVNPNPELPGPSAVDAASNTLTFSAGLPFSIPEGSLICSTVASDSRDVAHVAAFDAATAALPYDLLTLDGVDGLSEGERVIVYEPKTALADAIADLGTVVYLDSTAKQIRVSGLSAAHTSASVVIPLPQLGTGSEYALRAPVDLSPYVVSDFAGSSNVQIDLTTGSGPAVLSRVMVGDRVLVDTDSNLTTRVDQIHGVITAIQEQEDDTSTAPSEEVERVTVTFDAPVGFFHGTSTLVSLGDSFAVRGIADTSGNGTDPQTFADEFTASGVTF